MPKRDTRYDSGMDTMPLFWQEPEVLVKICCTECCTDYELSLQDLLEIHDNGSVTCECGGRINLHDELGLLWAV